MKRFAAVILCFAVAACDAAQPDQPRNFADPAVGEALSEPMMSDVDMHAAAAPDALRPADQPATMQIPDDTIVDTMGAPTLGQVAALRVRDPGFSDCDPAIGYSAQWSLRPPLWLELPDGARLVEAAGSDAAMCKLRIARFGMSGTPVQNLERHAAIAKRAGFTVRPEKGMIIATRAKDGAAFRIDATAIPNGTRIDLMSNRGR